MKNQEKAIEFIKKLESNGFVVENYNTLNKITEIVSQEDEGPVNLLNTLIQLKEYVENFDIDKISKNFNDDINHDFDNLSHVIKRSTRGKEEYEEIKQLTIELKSKIKLDFIEHKVTIDITNQKYQDLTNNPNLTPAQKWRKYKEMYTEEYNEEKEKHKFQINNDYINDLITFLENLYKEMIFLDMEPSSRKVLIDSFATSFNTLLSYKKELTENEIKEERYNDLKSHLGIIKKYEYNMRTPDIKLSDKSKEEPSKGKKVISAREDLQNTFDKNIMQYLSYGNIITESSFIDLSIRSVYSALFIFGELNAFKNSEIVNNHLLNLIDKVKKEIPLSNIPEEAQEELYDKYENIMRPPNIINKEGRSK